MAYITLANEKTHGTQRRKNINLTQEKKVRPVAERVSTFWFAFCAGCELLPERFLE